MAEFLNDNIKHIRLTRKMSQQKLADLVGVDRSTISRIENNEIETTIDNAIKIAKALNVSISELVTMDLTSNFDFADEENELMSKYRNLSTDDKIYIKNLVDKKANNEKPNNELKERNLGEK